jgi:hypothetical protein
MRFRRPGTQRAGLATAVLIFAIIAVLLNVPAPARASPSLQPSTAAAAAGSTPSVTWNGVDVSTASSASSALTIDLAQTANLVYNWPTSAGFSINDARLQMFYFGFAVTTRDQTLTAAQSSGPIPLSWTPLSISYVLEGVYRLTASLIAPNGSTMWSENFYVRGNAPLGFVAVLPIVLIVIMVYEVYGLFRSGRYAAIGRDRTAPPPASPPAATPPTNPPAPTEPTAQGPPPSGGSS